MPTEILIIHKSRQVRDGIIRVLYSTAYSDSDIIEAEDARQAIKKFIPNSTDLILAGSQSLEDRIDLVGEIHKKANGAKVIIIMVADQGNTGKMEEALNQGMNDYLSRPFTSSQLEQKLKKYFS